ncbi:MAG: nitrilase-related carbon-nitrogen hydrolase [Actinomycetota bacterium]|nr:nitrilase-related carbon-nitrogen hydrolase [Actinomycetota bacterium]
MPTTVRVGIAQLHAIPLDPLANAVTTVAAIEAAVDDGASVVVLPELVASGYVPDRDALLPIAESLDRPGPCLAAWQTAAASLGVTVIAGFAERDGNRLFNSAVTIDPSGQVASLYRKLHLFGPEWTCFEPGDLGLPIVRVGGVSIGVLVCYDLRFPEVMRIMALSGAELIAVPTAWVAGFDKVVPADGRIGQVDGAIVQANLNQVYVACADQVGQTASHAFLGRSVAVTPFGEACVGPMSPTASEVSVFDVDTAEIPRARHRGPGIDPFENRRTDVYGELLGYRAPAMAGPREQA